MAPIQKNDVTLLREEENFTTCNTFRFTLVQPLKRITSFLKENFNFEVLMLGSPLPEKLRGGGLF